VVAEHRAELATRSKLVREAKEMREQFEVWLDSLDGEGTQLADDWESELARYLAEMEAQRVREREEVSDGDRR
jgi:hypothetical protein